MTGPEMNGRAKIFRTVAAAALALTGAATAGCVAFDARTQAAAPIEPRIQAAIDAHRAYPRFEDFPKAAALPADAQIAASVGTLGTAQTGLAGEVSNIDWTLGDPAAFEREVQARLDATPVSPAAAQSAEEIEAFAQALRDRAKAPPPIDRPR